MTQPEASAKALSELAATLCVSEERSTQLTLDRQRLTLDHSLVLHRDSASAADIKAMIAHLEAAGMPPTATLSVDGSKNHTRLYARWSTEVPDA